MSNSRRSPTPALAIALSCLCGLGAGLLWLRGCPQQPVISEPVLVPDLGQAEDDEQTPVRELSGRVLLEPSEPGGALAAPKLGTCTASAWREGNRLAGPVDCDAEGRYTLTVDAPDEQAIAIEVLVPGRLRGLLEGIGSEPVPTVALGPASSVRGEVLDTRGRPLAGVLLEAMPTPSLGESEPWRVWSEADGTFVLDTVPAGHLNVRARHPGYAPTVSEVYAPEASVLVVLDGLLDLRGQIVGSPGLVSRATVRLEGSAIWPPIAGEVAQDGTFAFPGVLDGVYSLDAVVPAAKPGDAEYASVPLENVPPDMFVTLALIEAARVPVEVVDPDGEPVAGARVVLRYGAVGMLPRMATTDEQGFASPGPVVPGPYLVQVDADGYLPAEPLGVDVRTDVVAERQTVQLLRPASIAGRVVDGSGLSVADAEVLVESEAIYTPGLSSARASVFSALVAGGSLGVTRGAVPPIPMLDGASLDALGLPSRADDQRLRTTADGSFSLNNLPPGAYRLRARHDDYAVSDTRQVELKSGQQRTDVVLRLEDGSHFDGRVLDTNLQPIVGARVEFEDGTSVRTDARGVFDGGYRRGRQRVIIRADAMVPQELSVVVGSRPKSIEAQLVVADGWLDGRVVDGNLRPIVGVRVRLDPSDGLSPTQFRWTDDRGVFRFAELAPGRVDVTLAHPEYAPQSSRAKTKQTIELTLTPGWDVEIYVRTPVRGEPIENAVVRLGTDEHHVDADGRLELSHLTGDMVKALVRAPGRVTEMVEISRDGPSNLTIELEEASGMQGVITDERGEPVAGASIVVRDLDGAEMARTTSRAGGVWQAMGLAEGDYEVEAIPPPTLGALLAPVSQSSDVLRGHVTREVDLRFDRL